MVFSASLFLMAVVATVLTLVLPQFATFLPAALLVLGLSMFLVSTGGVGAQTTGQAAGQKLAGGGRVECDVLAGQYPED